MRSLGQAEKSLRSSTDRAAIESAATRLHLAQKSLRDMALLLERTMKRPEADVCVFDSKRPLATQVQRIIESLAPMAQQHGVEMVTQINPTAGRIQSGGLGTVVLNAFRNAIEACATSRRTQSRVEFSATINAHEELVLLISDNGPGLADNLVPGQTTKPNGHGFGLTLCRRIVADMGGRLEVVRVPGDKGTVVRVNILLTRLERG